MPVTASSPLCPFSYPLSFYESFDSFSTYLREESEETPPKKSPENPVVPPHDVPVPVPTDIKEPNPIDFPQQEPHDSPPKQLAVVNSFYLF